jgi:hypothetical protein
MNSNPTEALKLFEPVFHFLDRLIQEQGIYLYMVCVWLTGLIFWCACRSILNSSKRPRNGNVWRPAKSPAKSQCTFSGSVSNRVRPAKSSRSSASNIARHSAKIISTRLLARAGLGERFQINHRAACSVIRPRMKGRSGCKARPNGTQLHKIEIGKRTPNGLKMIRSGKTDFAKMLSNVGKRKSTSFPKSIRLNSRQISVIMATAHVKPVEQLWHWGRCPHTGETQTSLRKPQPHNKMFIGDKTILKQVLRNECLPALGSQSKYYSTETVKTWLRTGANFRAQRPRSTGIFINSPGTDWSSPPGAVGIPLWQHRLLYPANRLQVWLKN